MALAGTMAFGFGAVWAVVWSLIVGWIGTLVIKSPQTPMESLVVRSDGVPVIRSYSAILRDPYRYRDLQGNTIVPSKDEVWLNGAGLPGRPHSYLPPWGLLWSERIVSFADDLIPPNYWYLIHDGERDGAAYFVGYNSKTNTRLGFIGTAGFRADMVPAGERFRIPIGVMRNLRYFHPPNSFAVMVTRTETHIPLLLVAANRLYEVDLKERSVRVAFEEPAQRVLNFSGISSYSDFKMSAVSMWAVRTDDEVVFLKINGEKVKTVTIPAELRDKDFSWYELSDGRALALLYPTVALLDPNSQQTLLWLSERGEVEKMEQIDLVQFCYDEGEQEKNVALSNLAVAWICPAPAVIDLFIGAVPMFNQGTVPDSFGRLLLQLVKDIWPGLLAIHLFGFLAAWVCWRRAKRFALPQGERIAWAVFVFWFGLPGLIGFLFHQRWPVRERCPKCSEQVPVDRDACAACDTVFPEPALKGIEVLA